VYLEQLTAKMIRMAADRYAQIYRLIKATDPTAKVFCCGNFYGEYNSYWWQKIPRTTALASPRCQDRRGGDACLSLVCKHTSL
jgi:hypothetical protein